MWYLFIQIWLWLLVAFALGWAAHWFFCCRGEQNEQVMDSEQDAATLAAVSAAAAAPAAPVIDSSWKPQGFVSPPEQVDDLKRIKGIGAKIEQTLNGLGIYQYAQIADWNADNISWVEESLSFPGRIEREAWLSQAKTLAAGGSTEFAERIDDGEVDYD